MTWLSRRAFATAATASLLVGCGGHGAGQATTSARPASGQSSSRPAAGAAHARGRSVPVRLQIPAIGVDTALMRLGLASDGSVQVPPVTAHDRAGWYRHSPTPGQTGPSVVLGHVTVGAYGDGVFRHLARLHRGDGIVARLENGTAAVFTVTARFPADAVYGDVDRPELRLITCGGPRNGAGYLDNVIVFAVLSSANP